MKASATHQRLRMLAHVIASSGPGADQLDAFGSATQADQRRVLEDIADGPDASTRSQRPIGSDGGLFDTNAHKQIELF